MIKIESQINLNPAKGEAPVSSGIGFVDILVSEVTMLICALIFLFCAALLIFMRKTLSNTGKGLALAALVVTGIYLAFIIWLVFMWA